MKWLSVLALCAALFIAATHSNQLQDEEGMMDEADEEMILQILLADQANAENDEEIEHADEEAAAVYRGGRINSARDKANSAQSCTCHCHGPTTITRRRRWQKANAKSQCDNCCHTTTTTTTTTRTTRTRFRWVV